MLPRLFIVLVFMGLVLGGIFYLKQQQAQQQAAMGGPPPPAVVAAAEVQQEDWQPWPPEINAYFDPMEVIRRTTIPVLAVFGELDKNIDPIRIGGLRRSAGGCRQSRVPRRDDPRGGPHHVRTANGVSGRAAGRFSPWQGTLPGWQSG